MILISHTLDTQLRASCLRKKHSCALGSQVAAGLEKFLGVEVEAWYEEFLVMPPTLPDAQLKPRKFEP